MRIPGEGRLDRGNSQCGGPTAGVCLACLKNMFEEAGVAETSEGDSGGRGAWRDSVGPEKRGACARVSSREMTPADLYVKRIISLLC